MCAQLGDEAPRRALELVPARKDAGTAEWAREMGWFRRARERRLFEEPLRHRVLRFDPSYKDNPRVKDHPDVISEVPHVAFIVDDLAAEMAGKEVVFGPNTILDDWIVGWIMEGGVLVELIQTSMSDDEIRAMVARSE